MLSSPVLPCALIPQGLPPWGVVVQGISEGFSLCPLSLGSLSHCRAVASPSPVFWGGGGEKTYYYQLLLCTAVTLTTELVYKVTVGRQFTCVLDGFSDLIYVGLGG